MPFLLCRVNAPSYYWVFCTIDDISLHRVLYFYIEGATTQSLLWTKIGRKSPPNKYEIYSAHFGNYTNWIYLNWFKLFIQFLDSILCCRDLSLDFGKFICYLPCGYEETYVIADKVDNLNKRILRFILQDYNSPYDILLSKVDKKSLFIRRLPNIMITLYKSLFLSPQGFGPEAKTRGGTLGFPACIHTRNFKI